MASELSDYAHEVDVAFTGRQVSKEMYTVTFTLDDFEHDFIVAKVRMVLEVDWVYKGDVGSRVEIHSNYDSAACGVDFDYLRSPAVVAYGDAEELQAGRCDYPLTVSELEEVFGAGYPPAGSTEPLGAEQSGASAASPSDSAQPDASPEPQNADGDSESVTRLVTIVVVVAVAAVLAAWMVARRRKERRSPPVA